MGFYCLLLLVTSKNPAQMTIVSRVQAMRCSVRLQSAVVAGELMTRVLMMMARLLTVDSRY